MRVIEVARFGGPEVLVPTDAADPLPGPGQVIIDVAVADTLWLETMVRSGNAGPVFAVQPPYRPGVGVAGTVFTVGSGVAPQWIGRRVVARTGHDGGGYASRAVASATDLVDVPDSVEFSDAAAVLHDGVTALALMDIVRIGAGDRVLVTAAAGGMGAILVQLARASGATVVAAARGTAKTERVRELGADVVVDYSAPNWTALVREAVGQVDVVLDGAGGDYGRAAFELVAEGGRFSAHGTPAGGFAVADPEAARSRGITATGIEAVQLSPERFRAYLGKALAAVAAGRFRPLIGQTFALSEAADAHRAIESRAAVGKTLLMLF
jgi:NADPH2:quinone reductase